jgi:hypothetical protein
LLPIQVQGLSTGAVTVAAGQSDTCAVVNGNLQCWGYNNFGQLGDNSTTDSHVPVSVGPWVP